MLENINNYSFSPNLFWDVEVASLDMKKTNDSSSNACWNMVPFPIGKLLKADMVSF